MLPLTPPMDSGSLPATAMLSAVVLSFQPPSTPSLIQELLSSTYLQLQSPHTTPKYLARNTAAPKAVISSPAVPLSRASPSVSDPTEPWYQALTLTTPRLPAAVSFPPPTVRAQPFYKETNNVSQPASVVSSPIQALDSLSMATSSSSRSSLSSTCRARPNSALLPSPLRKFPLMMSGNNEVAYSHRT